MPVNVDTNKGIRCPPTGNQASVSMANLSVGRSNSPATAAMRQGFTGSTSSSSSSGYSSTNHRPPNQQQPPGGDVPGIRYVYPQSVQQQQQQYANMQQRDPGSVFVRNPVSLFELSQWGSEYHNTQACLQVGSK